MAILAIEETIYVITDRLSLFIGQVRDFRIIGMII